MYESLEVFAYGFSLDVLYVLWIRGINSGKAVRAGVMSVCLAVPGLLGYMSILENKALMAPYLLGLFLGTVVSISLNKGSSKHPDQKD